MGSDEEDHQDGFQFFNKQSDHPKIVEARKTLNPKYLYLDSTSSFHQVVADIFLSEVKKVTLPLRASCNAGTSRADEKGWYADLFHMWLMRNGIANLLSLPQLERDGFRVTYDTLKEWVIICPDGPQGTHEGGTELILQRDTGLCDRFPYLDMESLKTRYRGNKKAQDAVALVQTVRQNFEGFTKKEVDQAFLARDAQAMTGYPSEKDYTTLVSEGTNVKNLPVIPTDISNARVIFGPDLPGVRGKTVRKKHERVEASYISI